MHVGGVPQELHYVELLQPKGEPSEAEAASLRAKPAGRLDRLISGMPMALRVRARTWLGHTGRLL
jgi:hypothetical protein